MARLPLRLPEVTGPPPPTGWPGPKMVVGALPIGLLLPGRLLWGLLKGKLLGLTAVPVPDVPPDPKTRSLPRLKGPSNQSKPSSLRLVWVISMNLDSISTCFGATMLACSTNASTSSRLSAVLRTMSRLLCGRKFALAPGGNGTPWLSRKSLAFSRLMSCEPPVDSTVSLPVPCGADTDCLVAADWLPFPPEGVLLSADGPTLIVVLINPGGTRYSFVIRSLLCSLIGMMETAYGSTFTFNPA